MEDNVDIMILQELRAFRKETNLRFKLIEKRLELMEERLDRKSITNQFEQLKNYMNVQFERMTKDRIVNDIEHIEFKKKLKEYGEKLKFQESRIEKLEQWKDEFGESSCVGVC